MSIKTEYDFDSSLNQLVGEVLANQKLVSLKDKIGVKAIFVCRFDKNEELVMGKVDYVILKKVPKYLQPFLTERIDFVLTVDKAWWREASQAAQRGWLVRALTCITVDETGETLKVGTKPWDIKENFKSVEISGIYSDELAKMKEAFQKLVLSVAEAEIRKQKKQMETAVPVDKKPIVKEPQEPEETKEEFLPTKEAKEEQVLPTILPRKRGRPRKNPPIEVDDRPATPPEIIERASLIENSSISVSDIPLAETAVEQTATLPPRRKRGRPRKNPVVSEPAVLESVLPEPVIPESSVPESSVPESDVSEQEVTDKQLEMLPPRRKRGRPRKNPAETSIEESKPEQHRRIIFAEPTAVPVREADRKAQSEQTDEADQKSNEVILDESDLSKGAQTDQVGAQTDSDDDELNIDKDLESLEAVEFEEEPDPDLEPETKKTKSAVGKR
jgi:hypothetical protein